MPIKFVYRLGFAFSTANSAKKKLISILLHGHVIRPFGKSNFKCAEFNEDEENLLFLIICIRFGTCVVRSLKLALERDSVVLGIPFSHIGGFHVTSSPPCWWTVNKRSLISSLCLSSSICSFHHCYLCLPRLHENHLLNTSRHFLPPVHISADI